MFKSAAKSISSSLKTSLIRKVFQFLIARAARNPLMAFLAMIFAVLFARHLAVPAVYRGNGNYGNDARSTSHDQARQNAGNMTVFDGQYRRL